MPFRKRWCWLGAFGPEAMLCVAWAQVGVARVSWWAVWDGTALREGYRRSWRGVRVDAAGARVDGVLSLRVSRGRAIEARTGDTWTRKTPVRVEGFVHGRGFAADGLLDESAGRHPRRTSWLWSAGGGVVGGRRWGRGLELLRRPARRREHGLGRRRAARRRRAAFRRPGGRRRVA